MSLNFQQVSEKVKQIGLEAPQRKERLAVQRESARALLDSWAEKMAELRDKVERARQADPNLRCALPLEEPLNTSHPAPVGDPTGTLLAADGSQILPDRHGRFQYSLVNVGAIALQPGSGKPPDIFTDSDLRFGEELYTETGTVTGEDIEQHRNIAERKKLLELTPGYPAPLIALTDGPVELWGVKNGSEENYRKNLETHKSILTQLQEKNVCVAGYVDKPGADLVIRTLEITQFSSDEEYKNIRKQHPLRGVSDRWLFGFLSAGARSAVFGLQSLSRVHYTGALSLHFFYLNIGDPNHAWLARVEFPRWVAEDPGKLDHLQASLLQQCRIMGARPYPYILHRAHEITVVKMEDKQQVEAMLDMEIRRSDGEVEAESAKQSAKSLPGMRKR